jgi:hypothetical protein
MMGAFHCPHCGTKNACECKTCAPYIKKGEYINTWTADGESHICGKCSKIYSPDQSLDEEVKQYSASHKKGLRYWKKNAEEDYMRTPISVLRYISELEIKNDFQLYPQWVNNFVYFLAGIGVAGLVILLEL